uniref:Uncharacterized protein n=1 Tax=Aegilops tauschii TaxID=37682 RepID=M8CTI0_AEGTA
MEAEKHGKGRRGSGPQPAAAAAATPPRPLPRSAPPVRGDGGEAFRASQRYQSLLQDYKELLKSSSEETEEFHGYQETVRADKVNRYLLEGNVVAGPSDSKMPAFWDARNSAAARAAGKRKISWQDQLALRV